MKLIAILTLLVSTHSFATVTLTQAHCQGEDEKGKVTISVHVDQDVYCKPAGTFEAALVISANEEKTPFSTDVLIGKIVSSEASSVTEFLLPLPDGQIFKALSYEISGVPSKGKATLFAVDGATKVVECEFPEYMMDCPAK